MRRRPIAVHSALPLLVALLSTACGEADLPSAPEQTPLPPAADTPASADTLTQDDAVTYAGIPFGSQGLFAGVTDFEWGPAPFTMSLDNTFAASIVKRIDAARQRRIRLVLSMTGGLVSEYSTGGKFDLGKWKARMNTFNTATIKKAVADAVADGTVVGNKLIDEPESSKWGGVPTKAMVDQMAAHVKSMFPTLPVGVVLGAPGFRWRTSERYKVVDWAMVQYRWSYNQGGITAWRDAVVSWARAEGVTPAFSLNVMDGGIKDTQGTWDCAGTGGKGLTAPNCRMTADQVRSWGQAIGPSGCARLLWKYDDAFMAKSTNQTAFRDVASLLNSKSGRSCRRP